MDKKTEVPALDRGLDIIELVSQRQALSFGDIIAVLQLPTASAARILKRLCQRNYLTKDAEGFYLQGTAFQDLLPEKSKSCLLLKAASPVLKKLRDQISQTAILFYWNGQMWECLDKELHENSISMQQIGETRVDIYNYPWSCFAYAQLAKEKRKLTYGLDPATRTRMDKQLTEFKKQKFVAVSNPTLHRLAVPIQDAKDDLIGVLALGILPSAMETLGTEYVSQLLIDGGAKINKAM